MKNLFKSQLAYELICLLAQKPGEKLFLTEIAKILNKDAGNITRELTNLVNENLVIMTQDKGKKYYSFNQKSSVANELKELICKLDNSDFEQKFNTKWMLAEDIPNIDPFFCQMWMNSFVRQFAEPGGRAYKKVAAVWKEYHIWFYFDEKDAFEVGEHLVNKMEADPRFMEEINQKIVFWADKLRGYVSTLPEQDLEKYTNDQLWEMYKKQEDVHTEYYQWGWIPVAADMFGDNLTERGKKILRDLGVEEGKINEHLTLLNLPTKPSLMKVEQDELVEIGIKVQKDQEQTKLFKEIFEKFKEQDVKMFGLYTHSPEYEKKFDEVVRDLIAQIRPDILQDLMNHYTKYFYTAFLFTEEQGVYSFEHYLKALVRLVNRDPDLAKTHAEDETDIAVQVNKRAELIKELKLSDEQERFFDAWGDFMVTKIYRRFAQIYANYRMTPVLEEIGNRFGLTLKQTKFMTTDEIERGLLSDNIDHEEVKRRVSFSVYYTDKNENLFYTGEIAQKAAETIQKEDIEDVDEIKGQCGCQGSAKGTVKIVNVVEDMSKIKDGDILVSISTQPDLLPAMKKAAAFVTNQGGVTSHAAIVARELNVPCVIGTKIATKVLKDGDEVEVDATKGIVRKV